MNVVAGIGLVITGVLLLMNSFGYLKILPMEGAFGKPLLKWGWPLVSIVLGALRALGVM